MPNNANAGTAIVIIKILFMIQPFKQTEGNLFRVLRNGEPHSSLRLRTIRTPYAVNRQFLPDDRFSQQQRK